MTKASVANLPGDVEDPKETQILAAARQEFIQLGYAGTSMDSVARLARVSKTTLYTRFPSKHALFAAAVAAECRRSGMYFPAEEFDGVPVDEALRQIGMRFLGLVCSPEVFRVHQMIIGESARFPEIAQAFLREGHCRVTGAVAAYLERAASHGLLVVGEPFFAAGQFLMAMKGMADCELMLNAGEGGQPQDRASFVSRAVDLFLNGASPR